MAETGTESARRTPPKVPFHLPGIRKPQFEYRLLVDNSNKPFVHVGLERSDDGTRFLHPLEKLDGSDFVDRDVGGGGEEPVRPPALEDMPFMFVEKVEDLEVLAEKLRDVNEFAGDGFLVMTLSPEWHDLPKRELQSYYQLNACIVDYKLLRIDLEHNHFRSFQGLTCLMQISTRTEDFVVDTLKLRAHVGPLLQKVFRDPSKRKVMHGADSDILWLQKDFGIYVCNMFDTGQASRVMKLERKSLEYLLHHYCGVTANKEYQSSDWRVRPLPDEMIRYAREDTHYLLYLYDIMRRDLVSVFPLSENVDALLEVYRLSFNVCSQLYEKELLTDTSYLYIYRLHEADFSSEQLAVVAGLYEWRDKVARTEDESTGYILPNKALLEIARHMPVTPGKLRHLVKSRYPIVASNLHLIVRIIRNAIQNASAFENVSEQLKNRRLELIMQAAELKRQASCDDTKPQHAAQIQSTNGPPASTSGKTGVMTEKQKENDRLINLKTTDVVKPPVQILAKPNGASGAFLVKSSSKRKLNPHSKEKSTGKVEMKIEQAESLLSHSFPSGQTVKNEQVKIVETFKILLPKPRELDSNKPSTTKESIEIIDLESSSSETNTETSKGVNCLNNREYSSKPPAMKESIETIDLESSSSDTDTETSRGDNCLKHRKWFPKLQEKDKINEFSLETGTDNIPMSLIEVSSSFQKCFDSIRKNRCLINKNRQPLDSDSYFHLQPYDYAIARKQMKFTGNQGEGASVEGRDCNVPANSTDKHNSSFSNMAAD